MYNAGFNVLGLMSGTSLDGMDAALVTFNGTDSLTWELVQHHFYPYPTALQTLAKSTYESGAESEVFSEAFAQWTVQCIQEFQKEYSSLTIHLVSSHGQTIFHQPERKYTYQAGCLPIIAKSVGAPVVTDFRQQDVLLGGQGAPLVPFGDHKLFGNYEACLNLGGFANISMGKPTLALGVERAFDLCPVNAVLNLLANDLDMAYDAEGSVARMGNIHEPKMELLSQRISSAPASLGYEWMQSAIFPILKEMDRTDALATYVESIARHMAGIIGPRRTLITGGGAKNTYLIERMRHFGTQVILPDPKIIDFKEAIIFALLGYERFHGRINVLGHTTGSGKAHSSGVIFYP